MNELLCKWFVKDHENTEDPAVRESYGKLAGVVGIISNLILCAAKILIGIVSGSIAIIGDGINNLADASSSVITLVGFKLASMPEDKEHPYGHARYEYITGMIVSILIVLVGVELGQSSIDKVMHPQPLDFSWTIVLVLVLSIAIKIWQALFNIKVGNKIDSMTLIATGADSRNDVISTTVVLISVLVGEFAGIAIDGYMGCLVALFIIWSGISLVRETISPLLGEAPDDELVSEIRRLALAPDAILGVHDLVVHNYGPGKVFASIHIEVDADGDLMESHDLADDIEKQAADRLNIMLTCHLDPIKLNDPLVNQMMALTAKTVGETEGITNAHDLRVVPGVTHTNIIFDVVIEPGCKYSEEELHAIFEKKVKACDEKYCVVINFDKSYVN
ncbi:MAG: cation transporter [Firmicutes bacterium]|nr:cation transporter [Bacillota bacterium]